MKNIFLSAFLLVSILVNAQQSPANELFETHSGQEGYTSVYITKYMFELFAKITNEEDQKEFTDITSKLESIKILTIDSALNVKEDFAFDQEITTLIKSNNYKELMIVKEGKETIKFLINEKNDKISEFLMSVIGDGNSVLIFLQGDINLKQISKLSKTMNVSGFKHLDKIDNNDIK